MKQSVAKIVSGGQTAADRAARDWAFAPGVVGAEEAKIFPFGEDTGLDSQIVGSVVYSLVRINTKKSRKESRPPLAKGQIWKTRDHLHVQIVELGKMLVHYKLLRDPRQMRRTQMSRIDSMEEYLKTNKARLLEDVSLN